MKPVATLIALSMIATSLPAQAAQDMGLSYNGRAVGSTTYGMGAQANVRVKLGSRNTVRASDRVALGIAAGPIVTARDYQRPFGVRQGISPVLGVAIRPGYSASLSIAGQSLETHHTKLGAAESDQQSSDRPQKEKQDTGEKVAWVAAVAGGVMLVLVGIVVARCTSGACSD